LELSVDRRKWLQDTGICQRRGEFINLPAGEIFVAPREGSANGSLVIDGAFWDVLKEPVKVTIKDGYAARFVGAKNTVKALDKQGKKGRNVAELGIGMNPKAKIIGNVLEDEKVKGTVHIAFGDNSTFGGKIKAGIHMDGIITKPTLIVDDKVIMEKGEMKF
jgi:leucyl aminopeptidase (aminopeptidase T)